MLTKEFQLQTLEPKDGQNCCTDIDLIPGHPRNKPTEWLVKKSGCQTPKFGNHLGRAGPGQPQNSSVWVYPVFVFVCLVFFVFVCFCCFAVVSIGVVDSAAHAHPILGARPGQDGSRVLCFWFSLCVVCFCWCSLLFVFGTICAPERHAHSPIFLVFSLTMLCLEGLSLYILKNRAKLPAPGVSGLCTGDCIHNFSEETTQKV